MEDLEKKSIERIKFASEMSFRYYGLPIVCTYSGGKDSDVMLELFKRSGVLFEVNYSNTTADAPQTIHHIKEVFRELELTGIKCNIDYHVKPNGKRVTMWNLIPQKGIPPSRTKRYCCKELKETDCKSRMIATGVRWDESIARTSRGTLESIEKKKSDRIVLLDGDVFETETEENKQLSFFDGEEQGEIILMNDNSKKRRLIERCELKGKTTCNPIIDWTKRQLWEYIEAEHLKLNVLYKYGFSRVGCIGCPMADKGRRKQFAFFPKYKEAYIRAFERMLQEGKKRGLIFKWKTGEEVFSWWMEYENIEGQMSIYDFLDPI